MNTQSNAARDPSPNPDSVWRLILGRASCLCTWAQMSAIARTMSDQPGADGVPMSALRVEATNYTIESVGAKLPCYAIDATATAKPVAGPIVAKRDTIPAPAPDPTPIPSPVVSDSWADRGFSDEGAERAKRDQATAKANGFSLGQEFFAVGSLLYGVGVENARRERQAWEALPPAEKVCSDGIKRIQHEDRSDVTIDASSLALAPTGVLSHVVWEKRMAGNVITDATPIGMVDPDAYSALCTRMGIPADSRCTSASPIVRAPVFNAWATGKASLDGTAPEEKLVLRTRRITQQGTAIREIFAVVSPKYGALDVDKLLRATEIAIAGQGGRATFDYDGKRSQLRVIWHTNTRPEDCVVGEILQAWVGWSSDDTGGGSINIDGGLFHVLCKNLGHALPTKRIATIRHIGDVDKLARAFADGFKKAQSAIGDYVKQWNVATADDLRNHESFEDLCKEGLSVKEFMAATFRGLLMADREVALALPTTEKKREGCALPLRETVVSDLVRMWERDDSSATKRVGPTSVAAVTNAFTRYAHEVNSDPWQGELIERAGSSLLFDRDLPWALPDAKIEDFT